MSEEIKTRRDCPGCGAEQRLERCSSRAWWCSVDKHNADCPWWREFHDYNGDVVKSSVYADAYVAKRGAEFKPLRLEVGKAYRRGDGRRVRITASARDRTDGYYFLSEDENGHLWFNHRGEWVLNIERTTDAAYNLVAEWSEPSAAPVVPVLGSICSDPVMAAFIEDRREALRKALNAPPAFELGQKAALAMRLERCPCCDHPHCPECNGTGYQEIK